MALSSDACVMNPSLDSRGGRAGAATTDGPISNEGSRFAAIAGAA